MSLASPCPTALAADRAAFEEFLFEEARLLDARRFRDWMGLFVRMAPIGYRRRAIRRARSIRLRCSMTTAT